MIHQFHFWVFFQRKQKILTLIINEGIGQRLQPVHRRNQRIDTFIDEKCWNEFRNRLKLASSTEGDGSRLNCRGCNLFACPNTRITHCHGCSKTSSAVKYLRNDERLESDSRKSALLTLETGSNLFCLFQCSLHLLVSSFSSLTEFIIS